MTGVFMTDWFTLLLAFTVGLMPFSAFFGLTKMVCGEKADDTPMGCIIIAFLLLIAAIPLGYWCFQTFAVVYRP